MKKIRILCFLFATIVGLSPIISGVSASGNVVATTAGSQVKECKGIKLNTNLPFLGNCIGLTETGVNQLTAFPVLLKGLMKIIVSVVLVMSFLMIVAAGVLMATSGYDKTYYSKGIAMITTVAKALAMLGASGVILKLINPNFFT